MPKIEMGKKYRTVSGELVRIIAIDMKLPNFPVLAEFDDGTVLRYTSDGIHTGDGLNLVECSPYDNLKVDDKVLVWNIGDDCKFMRYFAGIGYQGFARTFNYGATSQTAEQGDISSWTFCEKV